jgi:hypothetical protein
MPGLPPSLHTQIRQALLDCDEINDSAQLRAILRTSALSPFANSFKTANNPNTQADYLIGDLADRTLTSGENALVLLLDLFANRYDPADARHDRLLNLATALQATIKGALPAATVNSKPVDRREALRQLREVLTDLYSDATSARRLVDDAGLPASAISFDGTAQNIWYGILSEAQKHSDGVERLLAAALVDYRNNKALRAAQQAILGNPAIEPESEPVLTTRGRHLRSEPDPQPAIPAEISKRYALLIGVRDYVDPGISRLPHTVADVVALEEVLTKAGYMVLTLHSAQTALHLLPTRANIWEGLDHLLADIQPNDLLLLHFGGHGEVRDGKAYLLAADTREGALKRTGIDLDELHQELERAQVQARILILDACHSGIGRSGGVMDPDFERHIYLQAAGSATLAACRQNQKAHEHNTSPHGAFTYFLLQGLQGEASLDQRYITFHNLNNYVTDQMKRWALQQGVQQTPNAITKLEGDPPLIILAEKIVNGGIQFPQTDELR